MTTSYDPKDASYLDEADLRRELDRVFDLCQGCRLCFNICPAFPTLLDFIDSHGGDAARMSPAEQDKVVDECYQCKLCYVRCPYVPPHEWELDFPRMMIRADAVRFAGKENGAGNANGAGKENGAGNANGAGKASGAGEDSGARKQNGGGKQKGGPRRAPGSFVRVAGRAREGLEHQFFGRTDLLGRLSTAAAPIVNKLTGSPGSAPRKAMQATIGVAADRMFPPYAKQRFSTWWRRRPTVVVDSPRASASVFPTCFIEYMEPGIGKDLVRVYERNNVACTLPAGTRCCGAPWLHSGDVRTFTRQAERNVAALAAEARAGRDIVVAQPTCAYVIRKDYPIYVGGAAAGLVSSQTYDACEYLVRLHGRQGGGLDTDFAGEVPEKVVYHHPCHLRAQNIGTKSRDLIQLIGASVAVVERCSGIDGSWGYRAENYELARKVAAPLRRAIEAELPGAVCGDCHLANGAILEETGVRPMHPLQLVARAYGIEEESALSPGGPLTLDDIAESRAYEREREHLRASVITLKRMRRIAVGPLVSIVLENRTTVRFQVQEMARAEQMTTDEQIQHELDTYNTLIPGPGEICATVFIELTSDEQMREWLTKLAGVERSVLLRIGGAGGVAGAGGEVVRGALDPSHESQLTREEVTASVHYVRFRLSPRQVERFLAAPVSLGFDHPAYGFETALSAETKASAAADWA